MVTIIVNPGESIQAAIDSLPPEGGTVELAEGTFNITSPIWINKNNVTLKGQGINETIINQNTIDTDGIIVSTFYDFVARNKWFYDNNIKWGTLLQWFDNHPDEVLNNVTITNISIFTPGTVRFTSIAGCEVKNMTISKVKITGSSTTHLPRGIFISQFVDVAVEDSIIDKVGEAITYHGGSYRGNVINTTISNNKQWTVIQYNGVAGLNGIPAIVKGNWLHSNEGSLYVYSSNNVLVTENLVENTVGQYGGILIALPTGTITVSNNTIRNVVYSSPLSGGIQLLKQYAGVTEPVIITGNIIYNAKPHGIVVSHDKGTLDMKDLITSNTISNSGGNGIHNPQGQPITVKNNIIVNNEGYGINNVANHSYNDVWNNTLGNYYSTSAGTGDISADPIFANPSAGDFHLKSQAGRWTPTGWVTDLVTSLCINSGDPASDNSLSLWGGIIEMGTYGNTPEASNNKLVICPIPICDIIITQL